VWVGEAGWKGALQGTVGASGTTRVHGRSASAAGLREPTVPVGNRDYFQREAPGRYVDLLAAAAEIIQALRSYTTWCLVFAKFI